MKLHRSNSFLFVCASVFLLAGFSWLACNSAPQEGAVESKLPTPTAAEQTEHPPVSAETTGIATVEKSGVDSAYLDAPNATEVSASDSTQLEGPDDNLAAFIDVESPEELDQPTEPDDAAAATLLSTFTCTVDFSVTPPHPTNCSVTRSNVSYSTTMPHWTFCSLGSSYIHVNFNLPWDPDSASLQLNHLTSGSSSCPGGGYSPVDITINGSLFLNDYDPAAHHGGSHGWVIDTWNVAPRLHQGANEIRITLDNAACTCYWLQHFQLTASGPPPCHEDCLENNDSCGGSATNISNRERQWLSSYSGCGRPTQTDDDWYRINVTPNYNRIKVDADFTDADGDIDIRLYDSACHAVPGPGCSSTSVSDDEHIDCIVAPSGGTYYIKVYFDDNCNPYDLWWDDIQPPPPCNNDGHCDSGETPSNCCHDCGCCNNGDCNDGDSCTNDSCVNYVCQNPPNYSCGDGNCDSSCGETLANCDADCDCTNNGDCNDGDSCTDDSCVNGVCQNPPNYSCGDGTCDTACGETSANCQRDCDGHWPIGGAVFSDCDDPIGSGEAGLTVSVSCDGGFSDSTTTAGGQGLWTIPDVPEGWCTVTVGGACYIPGSACPPSTCVDHVRILVNQANLAANQSLTFLKSCKLYDMNGDGIVSIIGDVPPFVDCLYFHDCQCPGGCTCPGDCNGDGLFTIIGDVPCFVNCLYFHSCATPTATARPTAIGNTFSVGGAIYGDVTDPLSSGVESFLVEMRDADGNVIASTVTDDLGIWRVDGVPAGTYTVAYGQTGETTEVIEVNEANVSTIQSLQLLHGDAVPDSSEVTPMESSTGAGVVRPN